MDNHNKIMAVTCTYCKNSDICRDCVKSRAWVWSNLRVVYATVNKEGVARGNL